MLYNGELKKNGIRLVSGIICCCFFFCIHFFGGHVRYQTNDDEIMNLIAAGAYGPDSQFLTYSNIVYGMVLKCLYSLLPEVNVYLWLGLILKLGCLICLCIVVSRNCDLINGLLITVLINLVLVSDLYNELQYSKDAFFYSVLGIVFLLYAYREHEQNTNWFLFLIGEVMFCFGLMRRKECFFVTVPLGMMIIGMHLLMGAFHKKRIKYWGIVVLVASGLVGTLLLVNHLAYYRDPEWKEYSVANKYRSELNDYGFLSYDYSTEEYDEQGITKTDLWMIEKWAAGDRSVFSSFFLEKVMNARNQNQSFEMRITMHVIYKLFHQLKENFCKNIYATIWLILFIFLLFSKRNPKGKILLFFCIEGVYLFLLYWYLVCRGRFMEHIEKGIWMSLLLLTVSWFLYNNGLKAEKRILRYGIIFVSMLFLVLDLLDMMYILRLEKYSVFFPDEYQEGYEFYAAIQEDREHVYILDVYSSGKGMGIQNILSIDRSYAGFYANMMWLGGWQTPSPLSYYYQRETGIDNPIWTLLKCNRALLVAETDHAIYIQQYLQEHYGDEYLLKQEGVIKDIPLWKVRKR
ncbi:MAG: hypothetical protein IJ600_00125 [Lachnospiraceae bacterium]|nr:hypothetical protein [Lachnospiraceae bacterium]